MKKDFVVKQRDIRDCGVCCLASIIKYYNGYIPIEKIRLDAHTNIDGTSAYHIITAANKYGFDGSGINTSYCELYKNKSLLPVIAYVTLKNGITHYVVIYEIYKNTLKIMDPAKGYIKVTKEYFESIWNGITIVLKPRSKILVLPKTKSILSLFTNIFRKEKRVLKKIILQSVIITIISIVLSYNNKIFFYILEFNSLKLLTYIGFTIILLSTFKVIMQHKRNKLEIYLSKNIDSYTLIPFLNHIFKLPLNVINSRSNGEIITRVRELNNIKDLIIDIFISVILDLSLALVSLCLLLTINKYLFFILCLIILLYVLVSIIYAPFLHKRINNNIELETEFNSNLVEYISSIDSIKNLNLINYFSQKLEISAVKYLKDMYKLNKFNNVEISIENFIYEIGTIIITTIGFAIIFYNHLTLTDLITFNSLMLYFTDPIKNMANLIPKYNLIKVSFNKISEFNSLKEENTDNKSKILSGNIEFKNITYSYNDYDYILNNLSFSIEENNHVFISGISGSGKSTLCKLLIRSDDNYKGDILIGGVNIKDYSLNTIRSNITYVSQNERLFTGTIRDNIILNLEEDTKKLQEVINICEIEEIINKKSLRLDTMLLDNASNLSGGERQRIILARALLQDKNIIILDEALNELEEEKEIKIINNIKSKYINKTIIYISHRNHYNLFNKTIDLGSVNNGILHK